MKDLSKWYSAFKETPIDIVDTQWHTLFSIPSHRLTDDDWFKFMTKLSLTLTFLEHYGRGSSRHALRLSLRCGESALQSDALWALLSGFRDAEDVEVKRFPGRQGRRCQAVSRTLKPSGFKDAEDAGVKRFSRTLAPAGRG
ncbi:hypothetical protein NDU88_003259 [Pleurodeles waltl]|uniref:Uncharacterized protein n=1 Tax=Pleurodeles waltl TaxID=8319 RepID=A0AAV7WSB3_PLEWA|nr:hypothetical protein NDU88_003259 [Pleurodeles waltl]